MTHRTRLSVIVVFSSALNAGASFGQVDLSWFVPFSGAESVIQIGRLPDTLPDLQAWHADDLIDSETYSCTWRTPCMKMTRDARVPKQPTEPGQAHGEFCFLWNGNSWYAVNSTKHSYIIDRQPRLQLTTDCLGFFNLADWPTMGAPTGLRNTLGSARILSHETAGPVTHVRLSLNPKDTTQLSVVFDSARRVISEATLEVFAPLNDGGQNQISSRARFLVIEWMTVDGREIPRRAIREAQIYQNDLAGATPDRPLVQRIGIVRHSMRMLGAGEITADLFVPPPTAPGDVVLDKQQRIAYTIGRKALTVNGQRFDLQEPIESVVTPEDLVRLMKTLEPQLAPGE
jgi:hypothetical protein